MSPRLSPSIDIQDIENLSRARLRERWRNEIGEDPPASFGRELLALGISYWSAP